MPLAGFGDELLHTLSKADLALFVRDHADQ